ncbi:hypothetical protein RFI_09556 [Reticulomyxa filosa]|uniref:Uncharacterized protein n=1 Tax=Reticulomyxa filosa TaxID=46433 RepID=X6NNK1_RETFI|nr:hypothetical protein RFI_09556 [Reticulomyxa filosa]|eukprot:ETO27576.1 hypothetical protein RFI_09556 [Reticulomyxa filosa]
MDKTKGIFVEKENISTLFKALTQRIEKYQKTHERSTVTKKALTKRCEKGRSKCNRRQDEGDELEDSNSNDDDTETKKRSNDTSQKWKAKDALVIAREAVRTASPAHVHITEGEQSVDEERAKDQDNDATMKKPLMQLNEAGNDNSKNSSSNSSSGVDIDKPRQPMPDIGNQEVDTFRFPKHMTIAEAQQLQVGDVIDHRDCVGRYQVGQVLHCDNKGNVVIKYLDWDDTWNERCNFNKELFRFAKSNIISTSWQINKYKYIYKYIYTYIYMYICIICIYLYLFIYVYIFFIFVLTRCAMKHLTVGDTLEVNPQMANDKGGEDNLGWSRGTIRRLDDKSGQVQVQFIDKRSSKIRQHWVHLDDATECAPANTYTRPNIVSWCDIKTPRQRLMFEEVEQKANYVDITPVTISDSTLSKSNMECQSAVMDMSTTTTTSKVIYSLSENNMTMSQTPPFSQGQKQGITKMEPLHTTNTCASAKDYPLEGTSGVIANKRRHSVFFESNNKRVEPKLLNELRRSVLKHNSEDIRKDGNQQCKLLQKAIITTTTASISTNTTAACNDAQINAANDYISKAVVNIQIPSEASQNKKRASFDMLQQAPVLSTLAIIKKSNGFLNQQVVVPFSDVSIVTLETIGTSVKPFYLFLVMVAGMCFCTFLPILFTFLCNLKFLLVFVTVMPA